MQQSFVVSGRPKSTHANGSCDGRKEVQVHSLFKAFYDSKSSKYSSEESS